MPPSKSFLRHVLAFVLTRERMWLLPIVLLLAVVALLASAGALAPYVALIYPL